jgi:hypothetical protein
LAFILWHDVLRPGRCRCRLPICRHCRHHLS